MAQHKHDVGASSASAKQGKEGKDQKLAAGIKDGKDGSKTSADALVAAQLAAATPWGEFDGCRPLALPAAV